MARIQEICCGDCDKCRLRIEGQVDMIPCVLDQMFRRIQNLERRMEDMQKAMNAHGGEIMLADDLHQVPTGQEEKEEPHEIL